MFKKSRTSSRRAKHEPRKMPKTTRQKQFGFRCPKLLYSHYSVVIVILEYFFTGGLERQI